MKRKHLLFVGAIIAVIALFGFGKTDAKADQEMVTEWYSEPHPEYFVFADCVEETSGGENATHYVYERYLWHDGKTWRATSKRLVPSDYTLNKYITSRDYGGVGKNTKKYNLWLSKEYDYPVQEESGGGYNVVSESGEQFHAWSFYTVTSGTPTKYRYRYTVHEVIVDPPVWDGGEYTYSLGGYYNIKTVPGLAFDVAWGGKENGSNLMIWDFNDTANQRFNFSQQNNGSYVIYDSNSGLCIDIAGDIVSGSNICMNAYNGSKSQQWYVGKNNDGTYSLISSLSASYVMDIENGTDGLAESNVHLWQWHGGQNQRFYIEKIDGTGSKEDEIISVLLNMPNGFELKNKNSGRMLNLYHGKTKDGSKFDTYPRDYTKTERFQLIISDKGLQFRNYCSEDKRMDVKTNGTGTPKEGNAVCLYKPTSDNCFYWKINYCGSDSTGDYVNIESVKTPGLYVGHPDNDLNGTKRNGLVLCKDGSADRCLWYIYNPDEKPSNARELFVKRVKDEYTTNGNKTFGNNAPYYMVGHWCARFLWSMAKEVGCEYAIPSNKNGVENFSQAVDDNGGTKWEWKDVYEGRYTPKAGDIIVYKSDKNSWQHVGMVKEYSRGENKFVTIEGNWGHKVVERTITVTNVENGYHYNDETYGNWYIRYILEPAF